LHDGGGLHEPAYTPDVGWIFQGLHFQDYVIRIRGDRWATAAVTLSEDQPDAEVLLTLQPYAELTGMVVTTSGSPVAGAEIRLRSEQTSELEVVTTGPDGRFAADTVPTDTYEILTTGRPYHRVGETAFSVYGETIPVRPGTQAGGRAPGNAGLVRIERLHADARDVTIQVPDRPGIHATFFHEGGRSVFTLLLLADAEHRDSPILARCSPNFSRSVGGGSVSIGGLERGEYVWWAWTPIDEGPLVAAGTFRLGDQDLDLGDIRMTTGAILQCPNARDLPDMNARIEHEGVLLWDGRLAPLLGLNWNVPLPAGRISLSTRRGEGPISTRVVTLQPGEAVPLIDPAH